MDLAVRIGNIITNNTGFFLFVKHEQPNPSVGFIAIKRVSTYRIADFQPGEAVVAIRQFLIDNLLKDDGIVGFRRTGNLTLGVFRYFPNQTEAELFARSEGLAYLVNIEDRTVVQVGDFVPDVPAVNL